MQGEKRFAALIDADNISAKYIKYVSKKYQTIYCSYKRIMGFNKPNFGS